MSNTITVPIGVNVTFDGGPYTVCEAAGMGDDGLIRVKDRDGNEFSVTPEELEYDIANEMEADEPVRLSTGDVGRGTPMATLELPLVEGFYVDIHALPGQGKDLTARLENLRSDHLRLRSFERDLENHGGVIEPIN